MLSLFLYSKFPLSYITLFFSFIGMTINYVKSAFYFYWNSRLLCHDISSVHFLKMCSKDRIKTNVHFRAQNIFSGFKFKSRCRHIITRIRYLSNVLFRMPIIIMQELNNFGFMLNLMYRMAFWTKSSKGKNILCCVHQQLLSVSRHGGARRQFQIWEQSLILCLLWYMNLHKINQNFNGHRKTEIEAKKNFLDQEPDMGDWIKQAQYWVNLWDCNKK